MRLFDRRGWRRTAGAIGAVVGAGVVVMAIGTLDVVTVSGPSMENTLHDGDRILLLRTDTLPFASRFARLLLRKNAIVIVQSPFGDGRLVVKRLVAFAGDRVRIRDGVLFVNETSYPEAATVKPARDSWPYFDPVLASQRTTVVPPASYFVLSDNRITGLDSRVFGPVQFPAVAGVALGVFH
jgi:signal peptidase I